MRCARSAISSALFFGVAACTVTPVQQPIDFSHQRHAEADIDCLTCHEKAADEPAATLPILRDCMKCHKEPQGKNPEEPKLRDYALRGQEVPWVNVNVLPGHVYFSHRAHVTFAEMDCSACHGDMTKVEHALTRTNVGHLTMKACIDCHQQKKVTTDCVTCHQ
jgi:hypothetical protein